MLPLQLLRINITNKGKNIFPVFCRPAKDTFYELKLAADMINEFEESFRKKETKRTLGERISLLESSYDDYRLVRGLYVLLERRCVFGSGDSTKSFANIDDNKSVIGIGAFHIRKNLFEESSRQGYALTEHKRKEIINSVASKIGTSYDTVVREMWADLDENLVLEGFTTLEPQKLISWYNLSLMQTLLFNSTKLEFSVKGGSNWKHVLRAVKKLGLMYNLYYQQRENPQEDQEMMLNQKVEQDINASMRNSAWPSHDYDNNILCSIDGPLSIFKLTDRYGTSIAKLLPSITETGEWSLKALIVRKTATMGKKIYEFIISSTESPDLPRASDLFVYNYSNIKNTIFEKPLSFFSSPQATFDSSVEQKFAAKFEQVSSGWRLIREPDPIIVSDGRGFIPDFAFEKYGIKVYLEIVGFWTNEYLVRKIQKIADVISLLSSSTVGSSPKLNHQGFESRDFFIAVNMDSYVSDNNIHSEKVLASLRLSDYIKKDHLIKYKNGNVPLKPILDHLRLIDLRVIGRMARDNYAQVVEELNRIVSNDPDNASKFGGIISLEKMAERYNVPVESILQVIRESGEAETGSFNDHYFVHGRYLIPLTTIREIKPHLRNNIRYTDACRVLAEHHVPEACYSFVLQKTGYDIIWHNMDMNGATIKLHDQDQ